MNRVFVLVMIVGMLFVASIDFAMAQNSNSIRDNAWTWGYVIRGKLPEPVPFVFPGGSSCSLETAAAYLGTPNVVLMNGIQDPNPNEPASSKIPASADGNPNWWTAEDVKRLRDCKRILCALHSTDVATAKKISVLSKQYPNIVGAMIDDFYPVEAKLPVEKLKDTFVSLKSENPSLKLYAVRYEFSKDQELAPYLPYIDVINLWVWAASKESWGRKMDDRIRNMKKVTGKPIVMGLYGPAHGCGQMECEYPFLETSSSYTLIKNMTFQIDIFLADRQRGFRWEDAVIVTDGEAEQLSALHREVIVL